MVDANVDLQAWVGRRQVIEERLGLGPARAAAATLDGESATISEGMALPPLWQWFYFLPVAPQSQLSTDGHPERGGFLPPVPLPRRMFAGARIHFRSPLRLGEMVRREGTVEKVSLKTGKSGALAFVTVRYLYVQEEQACIEEVQDIVYREPGAPVPAPTPVPTAPPPPGAMVRTVAPDPRLLFRFSALTFNAHRIHYDRDYAIREEGYPGLVVHGPLTALLALEMARAHVGRSVSEFSFRGKAPLFDLHPFCIVGQVGGDEVRLEARAPDGAAALEASVRFSG